MPFIFSLCVGFLRETKRHLLFLGEWQIEWGTQTGQEEQGADVEGGQVGAPGKTQKEEKIVDLNLKE